METFTIVPKEILERIISNQELILTKINHFSSEKKNSADFFKYRVKLKYKLF